MDRNVERAIALKKEGLAASKIAKKLGVSKQAVHDMLGSAEVRELSEYDYSPVASKRRRQQRFLAELAANNFDANIACKKSDVGYSTYRNWCRTDAEFVEHYQEVYQNMLDGLQALGIQLCYGEHPSQDGKPNDNMLRFMLKSLHKSYQDIRKLQVSGKVDHEHHYDYESWTDEQIDHYLETGKELELEKQDDGSFGN